MKTTNGQKIKEILTRGVERIYPTKESLGQVLLSGKKLKIYNGVDPTNPNMHIGNAVALWKLREFQELGHKVILLLGDFTGRIGDPSDKSSMRPCLNHEQVLENTKTYKEQASKILDFESKNNPCGLLFNSAWLDKLTNKELLELAGHFTVQQMIERDLFQKRLAENKPIGLHEFLYPLYQGYDSVAMEVDMEIGGQDQTFNMLVGRDLVESYLKKEKFVLATTLLEGTDGRKMSKSWGNVINLNDSPNEKYGKVMSIKDELIVNYFRLGTRVDEKRIEKIEKDLKSGKVNPRNVKAELAREIVSLYHGERIAEGAEKEFDKVFKDNKVPTEIPEFSIDKIISINKGKKTLDILDLLVEINLVSSKSEAKRMIIQKGIKINGKIWSDWKKEVEIRKGIIIQAGKRKAAKII